MNWKDDVRIVIIALTMCILAPFTLISSFVFAGKLYSTIFNIPCEICEGLKNQK